PLNLFALPPAEYDGDERMFQFMHSSWHQANNGGVNDLYLQDSTGHFVRQDPVALGMPETRWSLALGTGDLNQDGYTDLYVANDFGPDDLYLNEGGKRWHNVKGTLFGSVGRDTYKGMNASVADLDRNDAMDAAEFGFLVKGWEEAEIAGAGSGRFVEPFFHIDERSAAAEHAELARAKFAEMAGEVGALSQKKYTRKVIEDFKRFDANDDDLLRGEELLNFRAAVRGEPITPIEPEASAVEEPATE
ncbi:MAG TPA: VCBS repeat-containing protein, partial [Parvularculaceae bacterium]|nr:VCBS repeat-containing protein [Parvularculaceae bacterium]